MSESTPDGGDVLIVEDEADLADLYADYLPDKYDATVVYSGEDALEELSERFEAVLLDRRMPVVSGTEILAEIENRGLEPRVALVTAVTPDFEIVNLDIDDYLVKPITQEDLRETVDRLFVIREYNDRIQELTAKKLKRNVLEREKNRTELQETEEFQELVAEIDALESEVDSIADELDTENPRQYL